LIIAGAVSAVIARPRRVEQREARPAFRSLLSVALPSTVAGLGVAAFAGLDQAMLALVAIPRDIGFYAVGFSYASLLEVIVSAVWFASFRDMARSTQDETDARRVARITLGLSVAGAVFLASLAPWVLPTVFGARFDKSVGIAIVLLTGRVFHDLYAVQGVRMVLREMRLALTVIGLTSFGLVALAAWIGYSAYGIYGAALGVVLAEVCRWAASGLALSPRTSKRGAGRSA
jgi:O-antigen/teichoic acid export membrane protein